MTLDRAALVAEAIGTGTLKGLPGGYLIDGAFAPAVSGRRTESFDPGGGRPFRVSVSESFAGGIEVPFGDNRKPGFGREKGMAGLRSSCNLKSVVARI